MLRKTNLALANSTDQFAGYYATVFPAHTKSKRGLVGKDIGETTVPVSPSRQGGVSLRSLFVRYSIDLSKLSMYFDRDLRLSLARRLKLLLNEDNWDDDDKFPSEQAFLTLLRCMLVLGAETSPSIGTNGRGSLSATWVSEGNRITLECAERDKVSFVLTRRFGDAPPERAAGHTNVDRLVEVLAPYQPQVWFDNA